VPIEALVDEDEIRRLQAMNRRGWGALLLSTGVGLLILGGAVLLVFLWLISQVGPVH
jgi:hypothetical protein